MATVYDRGFADVTPEVMREYYSHTWFAGRVFKHWFSNYTDVWPKDREDLKNFNCLEWAEKLNVPEDVRYKLLKIFADFESAQNLLLDTLLGVYEKILLLRQKHENVIQNAIRFFNTDESFLMLQAITGEDLSDYDFTVTLINSIQISYSIPQKHVHLGKDALEVQDWEKRVTPKSFALAYSDELRRKIIKILTHKGPQTPQQLCEELGQSPMTISHNINFLFFEGIIMPCRNEQQEFAFRLNKKYFQILSQKLKGDFFK